MVTRQELEALVVILRRSPMNPPESLCIMGIVAKLDATIKTAEAEHAQERPLAEKG